MRLRLYTEQGGVVERSFLGLKTEFAALVLGFKGGSLQERPKNPEKKACVVYKEYDRKLVRYLYEGYQVTLRYNPSNIVYILVYTREKNGTNCC
ncbi:MAG: hypothetical protein LDL41_07565 [Coleofasciculus sp. S288]|nr:hypothetical protein [Coleofasciculus sp. S288]